MGCIYCNIRKEVYEVRGLKGKEAIEDGNGSFAKWDIS